MEKIIHRKHLFLVPIELEGPLKRLGIEVEVRSPWFWAFLIGTKILLLASVLYVIFG